MADVKVHYNSPQPARLNALAYAQGADIHLAPRQERHLPHEAWHVVQQKQGRVQAKMQMKGIGINDVAAVVNGGELRQSLLGMSYLSRYRLEIDGDRLLLSR